MVSYTGTATGRISILKRKGVDTLLFSSLEFLFMFLPASLLIYYIIPAKHIHVRNFSLLVFSLIFYGWGEPLYVFLMIGTVALDYVLGLLIGRYLDSNHAKAKLCMIIGVVSNLGILAFFKYYDFFAANISRIPGIDIPSLNIGLPIGISFYTFQIMSYVVDVYRRDARVQRDPFSLGAYLSLFPQLIAGPIVRYRDVDEQLTGRTHSISKFSSGVSKFCVGLAKKVLLANNAGAIFDSLRSLPQSEHTVVGAWLGIVMFAFQIYFDFSGYSDMAVGLGRMLGFEFIENFNFPYISTSITDFWRRWHISLSTFFREYVYIPLGGNRRGKARQYFNLAIVWALTGFWHGASWNYLLWGLFFLVFLVIEKAFLLKLLEKLPNWLRRIYALTVVLFGWLLFVFEDLSEGAAWLGNMFGNVPFIDGNAAWTLLHCLLLLAILVIASTPCLKRGFGKLTARFPAAKYAKPVLCCLSLVISVAYLVDSGFNPFLYTRF